MTGLWGRLFGHRERAVIDRRRMNEDWRVGDLAVCICSSADWDCPNADNPDCGEVRRVSAIKDSVGHLNFRAYFLCFVGYDQWWECTAFRKAVEDAEPAEAEFTALIRRPVRVPVKVGAR